MNTQSIGGRLTEPRTRARPLASTKPAGAATKRSANGPGKTTPPAIPDRMKMAMDAVPVEIDGFDPHGRLTHANRASRLASPWLASADAIGKTFGELMRDSAEHYRRDGRSPERAGADWEAWIAARVAYFETGGTIDIQRPAGDWRRTHLIKLPDGSRVRMRLDITELKEREEMLAASERRYTELVDSLPDVVISLTADDRIEYASRAATAVLGQAPELLRGRPLLSLVSGESRPPLAAMLARVRAGGDDAPSLICEVLRGDAAGPRLAQITLSRRGAVGAGGAFEIGGLIHDVHDQQTTALKLEREMEQLNSVFQSTGAYFLMLDRDERIVLINQALRDLRGYGDRTLVGRSYRDQGNDNLGREVVERWRAHRGPDRLEAVEYESKTLDTAGRTRILKITATPVQDKTGQLRNIVLIGIDDTERRQAEIRLFDASRLSNLGEMASGIAHEINQPLAVIRLAADSLLEEIDDPQAQADPVAMMSFVRGKLERIAAQTERASNIIKELRTVARKPSDDAQPFDLSAAARVAEDLLREQLRAARVDFTLDLPAGSGAAASGPMVLGEASRLMQVVISVALNARDAIVERRDAPASGVLGHITVRVAQDEAAGQALMTIEDDGPGIPAKALSRIFEPFFTTKPPGKGTGLGLSIGYDILRRMGGEITADNRPEGGARFRIALPLHRPPAALAA